MRQGSWGHQQASSSLSCPQRTCRLLGPRLPLAAGESWADEKGSKGPAVQINDIGFPKPNEKERTDRVFPACILFLSAVRSSSPPEKCVQEGQGARPGAGWLRSSVRGGISARCGEGERLPPCEAAERESRTRMCGLRVTPRGRLAAETRRPAVCTGLQQPLLESTLLLLVCRGEKQGEAFLSGFSDGAVSRGESSQLTGGVMPRSQLSWGNG